ncbi:lysine-specific demethylase 7B isoform X2 [Neoarius graeffei]|uniref:lysine-specific demethylase 7B isoform X2 n=1 Tax=Neoarius graeffei TaxID=443677 RepID=UPI00298BF4CC|nr:lysine-specific demethylase 7B isoform X2 [Neoarius graeffei]
MKMATVPLYCVCRQPYDVSRFMIECDICKDWFHGSCVQVEEHHAVDIDVYHCPSCEVPHGPSLMKKRKNWHRHDYTEPDDGSKPVQAGTLVFVRQLQARTFVSADEVLVKMHGRQVTQRYLERHGFRYPIAVTQKEGLGLQLPSSDFSVKDVERYVGGDKVIDVIDVARQADSKMKLKEFVKYYYSRQRPKVLNVISLEFSDTKMSKLVVVPDIAQKMSWVENYWPDDSYFPKPFVQKYCLMGVKGSYTDFHIDFGGTSVWYHVLWGEKIFYLIKPTPTNLALYEEWSSSPNQSEVFFGEKVDKCYKCVVRPGTTLFIPTGWIHGVLTSEDCMAFGGNFLHNLNIGMQLRCYEMERRLKTPDLFKFPYFEAICWYVAKNLLETLKELREDNCVPPGYLTKGVKALITALKNWLRREVTEPASEVPDHIRPNHLIKELTKEIRHLEEDQGGNGVSKSVKSQGSLACPSTRSSHERSSQMRKNGRRLRHHHHHHHHHHHNHHHHHHNHHHSHTPRAPSNLDIFEQHTQEVLRRLEMSPFEDDSSFNLKVKFNKVSTASAAAAERKLDNHLRLVMCNGRIIRDDRWRIRKKNMAAKEETSDQKRYPVKVKAAVVKEEEEMEEKQMEEKQRCTAGHETPSPLRELCKRESSDFRNGGSGRSTEASSDSESERRYTTQKQQSSGENSESSSNEDEKEEQQEEVVRKMIFSPQSTASKCNSSSATHSTHANQQLGHHNKPHKREPSTSLSAEEDAIQGMLSMASLLYPHPSEEGASSQESWWSCTSHPSPDYNGKEAVSGEENPDSDSNSTISSQDERQVLKRHSRENRTDRSQRLQDNQSFMDSQGSGNSSCSSSEAWGSHTHSPRGEESPESRYQYCEMSLSPPLHPTKRPATNPPPISNQATKGKRPKKGMATAKQRLGKILKLNRHKPFFV